MKNAPISDIDQKTIISFTQPTVQNTTQHVQEA